MTKKSKRKRRGFSLLEILVVLSIIALLTTAVAIGVMKHLETARIQTTRQSALALRTAAMGLRMQRSDVECPTVELLVKEEAIDQASKAKDAWDQPFAVSCDDKGAIRVASGGPDKKLGTPDDVVVPDPTR